MRARTTPVTHQGRSLRVRSVAASAIAAAAFAALALAGAAAAQDTEDCILCHEDADLTGERGGREISMHVDPASFAASVHGEFDCVDCHQDIEDVPHDDDLAPSPAATVTPTRPRRWPARVTAASPADSRRAPRCADCHGSHEITSARAAADNCASCHASQARTERRSLHGQAAARGDALAPTCGTCHGSHEIPPASDRSSPTAVMNVPLLCGRCHQRGLAGVAEPRDPPGSHPRELLDVDPRRGSLPPGADGDRGLHLLPHRPQHPAATTTRPRASTTTTSPRPASAATARSSRSTAR